MATEKSADNDELGMDTVCRFAGHLAHELNNLLTPIIACGQMLCEGIKKDDPLYFCAEQVAEAGERCLALSQKLQIIGSRRSGGRPLAPSVLIPEAIKSVTLPSDQTITITAPPGDDAALIRIDMEQFIFMVSELINNAVRAMPRGGDIRVGLQRVPAAKDEEPAAPLGWVVVTVEDQGTGMTPEVMARMYEPFFSSHGKDRDKGLGLTLVYGIVRRAGGIIRCESTLDTGTIFHVYFPHAMDGDQVSA